MRIEPRLEDEQSGVAGWRPIIDGAEVSQERWEGAWPDGTYQLAVRATDRAGNESVIVAAEEIVVDAVPPVLSVTAHPAAAAARNGDDSSRCGWLLQARGRWPSVTQCRWVRKAQRRWLRQGWNWLEVSVDGSLWNPLIAVGSAPAREVARARYRLPAAPATITVGADHSQLLVRAADGSPLLLPGLSTGAPLLRLGVADAGAGVERMRLRVDETESGVLTLSAEATDARGHRHEMGWPATAER